MLKLVPIIKKTIWGGNKLSTEFSIGENNESVAEAWLLSCRENENNVIFTDNGNVKNLADYINENPNCVGIKNFNKKFPLLIKLIDAQKPLSIQVHPNDEYAKKYTSDSGKTEMWYIVDAEENAKIVYGLKENYSIEQIEFSIKNGTFENLLNYVSVKKGDIFLIPSGLVHAIGAGILIAEIQQNSDITYRVYDYNRMQPDGTYRKLHIDNALEVIKNTNINDINFIKKKNYLHTDFFTTKIETIFSRKTFFVGLDTFYHVMIIDGIGKINDNNSSFEFKKGDSFFIPAGTGNVIIDSEGAKFIISST